MSALPNLRDTPHGQRSVSAPVGIDELPVDQRSALKRFGTWQRFGSGPRRQSKALLGALERYPNSVLVAGCQRSGTTMLTRLIASSSGFRGLALTRDDELDAALALCGEIDLPRIYRYCFQTTYLNERYHEYGAMGKGHKLIWVLRNPRSVTYSMVYNWPRFALNELYESCGIVLAEDNRLKRHRWPWPMGPRRAEKACLSYSAKTSQIVEIREMVQQEQILVVDYDALVDFPHEWLARVFAFIDEPYIPVYARAVSRGSKRIDSGHLAKAMPGVAEAAERTYEKCLALYSGLSTANGCDDGGARNVGSKSRDR